MRTRPAIAAFLLAAALFVQACTPESEAANPAGMTAEAAVPSDTLKPASIGAIPNVHRIGNVIFAGQPAPADFAALQAEGVTKVINLRPDAEMGGFDEAAAAEAAGMGYASVPWNGPAQLTDEVFGQTRELLRAAEGNTLLHCASANRVGAVWIPFRVLDQGIDLEQAVAEAKAMGMRTAEYETKARDYVARNR